MIYSENILSTLRFCFQRKERKHRNEKAKQFKETIQNFKRSCSVILALLNIMCTTVLELKDFHQAGNNWNPYRDWRITIRTQTCIFVHRTYKMLLQNSDWRWRCIVYISCELQKHFHVIMKIYDLTYQVHIN